MSEYAKLSQKKKDALKRAVSLRRRFVKNEAIKFKGGKCEVCGYSRCNGALEFHHRDPNQKDFSFSRKGYTRSLAKALKEVEKCVLLCANCHREVHHNPELIVLPS